MNVIVTVNRGKRETYMKTFTIDEQNNITAFATVPTANAICGVGGRHMMRANQMLAPRFAGRNGGAREVCAANGHQKGSCRGLRTGLRKLVGQTDRPSVNLGGSWTGRKKRFRAPLPNESWIQNRIQLAPERPNMPKECPNSQS